MRKTSILILIICAISCISFSDTLFVDSMKGSDNNPGTRERPFRSIQKTISVSNDSSSPSMTVKINPGIYVLDSVVTVRSTKKIENRKLILEASILPDASNWNPEDMPVVISICRKGEIDENPNFVVGLLVDDDNVTIRGLKFHGYLYPNTRYFPIARLNPKRTGLLVEKSMFLGHKHASHLQVGVIAHGDEVTVKNCVFNNVNNAVVFWKDSGNGVKSGNSFTHNIATGVLEGVVWTCTPDNNFLFENNVITNSRRVWIVNTGNSTKYTMRNCVITNNEALKSNWEGKEEDFNLEEHNVIKDGDVDFRLLESIDGDIPMDYLHIPPGTLGHDLGAGLFEKVRPSK